jgi:DNA-binding PadR family transcriptional regulator
MRYALLVLEMAVLGLLKEQDMHGYELKKRLSDVFGVSSAVSFGSLYPALARLEAAGAVRVVSAGKGQAAPVAGPAASERRLGRRRKVYGITALGASVFEDLLANSQGSGEDERSFNLRLAFARYLPPEGRLGLLEQRRAVLGERLAQAAARARARREDRYMRILSERQQDALSRDVSWLDNLIREERASATSAGAAPEGAPNEAQPPQAAPAGAAPARATPAGGVPPEGAPAEGAPARTAGIPARASVENVRLVPLASASQLQRAAPAGLVKAPPKIDNPAPVEDHT